MLSSVEHEKNIYNLGPGQKSVWPDLHPIQQTSLIDKVLIQSATLCEGFFVYSVKMVKINLNMSINLPI